MGGEEYRITCVSMGNPHCVVEMPRIEGMDIAAIGPKFERNEMFPERINTEFVRVVNRRMIKMRVWERGNGETLACGTGACAAVAALAENGLVDKNKDITVKVRGGELIVRCAEDGVYLTGEVKLVYTGIVEF